MPVSQSKVKLYCRVNEYHPLPPTTRAVFLVKENVITDIFAPESVLPIIFSKCNITDWFKAEFNRHMCVPLRLAYGFPTCWSDTSLTDDCSLIHVIQMDTSGIINSAAIAVGLSILCGCTGNITSRKKLRNSLKFYI